MKNRLSVAIIIALLFILAFLSYILYLNISDLTAEPVQFLKNKTEPEQENFSLKMQYYSNMRFAENEISYYIEVSCEEDKREKMRSAFGFLEQETPLRFFENSDADKTDILVGCEKKEEPAGKYFIAGEGGPTTVINTSLFYVIEKGKVLLFYGRAECDNYNIELHELLHVFGFEHSENKNSIMHNTTSCRQTLTQDLINELKRLYSIENIPDLYFTNISAVKHGSYVDSEVEIRNGGLNSAENVKLELYGREGIIEEFNLGNIGYGEGSLLDFKNIRAGRKTNYLKFVLVDGKELDSQNNIAELYLPQIKN